MIKFNLIEDYRSSSIQNINSVEMKKCVGDT